ncbi:MAG: thiamine pyrophosphate-binding protein, partial [Gammaproteobacteria bacterium]|nr:thiamine pyrophosphate-binding protein [Gammaproteobacteria bacterium]
MAEFTGRNIVMETFVNEGVDFIFGNPGTTELPLLDALADYPQIQYILALQEAVVVSMADAYAQVSGKVGIANVHVGPGLGNGLGSLYNAWEGQSPLIVTAGQQDTRYRLREPVLWHDLVAMAAPLTKWSVQAESTDELPELMHRAFKVARDAPTGPVFVALPMDVMIGTTSHSPLMPSKIFRRSAADPAGIAAAVDILLAAKSPMIFAGDKVARCDALGELVDVAQVLGAGVYGEVLPAHLNFPNFHPNAVGKGAGDYGQLRGLTAGADVVLLVGGEFFEEVWYVEGSPFAPGTRVIQIDHSALNLGRNQRLDCGILGDPKLVLTELLNALKQKAPPAFVREVASRNEALAASKAKELAGQAARVEKTSGNKPMSSARLMAELRAGIPDNTMISAEAITAGAELTRTFELTQPSDYLSSRGGGIGQGVPGAIGMKLAFPDRPALCITGDGSSLYTIQALWTAAHHDIPIVFVILNNRVYRILKYNMNRYRQEARTPERKGYLHMDLTHPDIDFVSLAKGFGLEAKRIVDAEDVRSAVREAFASGVPYLLDV